MGKQAEGEAQEALYRLTEAAGLPGVVSAQPIDGDGYGLDNLLTKADLEDGRTVVLRQSRVASASPKKRIEFLHANGITTPALYASDDAGTSLWEYIPGCTLADAVANGSVDAPVWQRTGTTLAEVHAIRFPTLLEGAIEADRLTLRPVDPVEALLGSLARSSAWVEQHRPRLLDALRQVSWLISRHAAELRSEAPSVVHGDINLLNIIVTKESVRLIDWDFPAVKQPLAELSALDEHAYLNGLEGLPPAFFDGYGVPVRRDLLLLYRVVGCIEWLASDDWAEFEATPHLPTAARLRLERWHQRLLDWCDRIPDLVATLPLRPR